MELSAHFLKVLNVSGVVCPFIAYLNVSIGVICPFITYLMVLNVIGDVSPFITYI